jgi:hypothetical protein
MPDDGPRSGDHQSEPEQPPPLLASDAERDQSVELLRSAVVDGRLTLEEFTERVELAQAARTDLELAALSRDLPARRSATRPPSVATDAPAAERHRAVCSRISRSGPWSLPARGSYSSIFGTIDLDLRQARLSADVTELEVFNLFGTVTVIVPEGVEVSVDGGGLFASQVIDSPQVPPVRDAPKLQIHASGPGGTLYVRTKPPAGTLEKLIGTARAVRELHGGRGDSSAR